MKKPERREANARALEILKLYTNEEISLNPSRKMAIADYTGRGGVDVHLNEYYTTEKIIPLVHQALLQLGYSKGIVLEPSCGTGRFMLNAPDRYLIHGIEIDPTSARIAQILYPQHHIERADFRRFAIAQSQKSEPVKYDIIMGNPPFGTFTLNEDDLEASAYGRSDSSNKMECFFVEECCKHLNQGGILAMVLPYSCLSGEHLTAWRDRLDQQGMHLLGALRFPERTHDGTGVVSDVWFLAKGHRASGDSWFIKGEWMDKHSQFILGTPGTRSRYGKEEYTVKGTPNWEYIETTALPSLIKFMKRQMKSWEIRPSNHQQGAVTLAPGAVAEFTEGEWRIGRIPLQTEEELTVSIRNLLNMSFNELVELTNGLQVATGGI